MYDRRAQAPQFDFNNFFSEHFPQLIFFQKILSRKNWQSGGELLLKNVTMDSYAY